MDFSCFACTAGAGFKAQRGGAGGRARSPPQGGRGGGGGGGGAGGLYDDAQHVVVLTERTFPSGKGDGWVYLIEFYAPWYAGLPLNKKECQKC